MTNLALYAVIAVVIYLVYINLTAEQEKPKKLVVSVKPAKPLSPIKFIETELQKKKKYILKHLLEVKKMKKNNVNSDLIRLKEKVLDDKYPNLIVNIRNPKNNIIATKIAKYLFYPSATYNAKKAADLMAEMV